MGGVRAVGLFSGIGGFELGMSAAGIQTDWVCEHWAPAAGVLRRRFDAEVVGDVREIVALPQAEVVTAGFPCTDLSQVGRGAGISGSQSGLVGEVFRLVRKTPPTWLILENVPNMLSLHGGSAMQHITGMLEDLGWNWAYRIVDSQYFGVRQRRRRVFVVASPAEDPRSVLFADETSGLTKVAEVGAYGFSWTEGNNGIGWGEGVTPTLKGGSGVGIPSPPGVWIPGASLGNAVARPTIRSGERLQGFRAGWTDAVPRLGERWKLVGNAVTVPVARWVGQRLIEPGAAVEARRRPLVSGAKWPRAASSMDGVREAWDLSERPIVVRQRTSLDELLELHGAEPLTYKATAGFTKRLKASRLRTKPGFISALDAHIAVVS